VIEVEVILDVIGIPKIFPISTQPPACRHWKSQHITAEDAIHHCQFEVECLFLLLDVVHLGQVELGNVEVDAFVLFRVLEIVCVLDVSEIGHLHFLVAVVGVAQFLPQVEHAKP
jgi:hypothetical protein